MLTRTAIYEGTIEAGREGARPIAMILDMDFTDTKAIEDCLASKIRPEPHAATLKVMKLFDGVFYHLVTEATVLTPAP